jgi:hypothetical protein
MQGGSDRMAEEGPAVMGGAGGSGTGTSDPTYNLISVAYHLLQGAETIQQYIDDAKQGDDKELLKYLRQVHRQYVKNADQAKQLMAERLTS